MLANDGDAACQTMTAKARTALLAGAAFLDANPESCAEAADQVAQQIEHKELEDAELSDLSITGTRATGTYGGETSTVAKVNGRWLIAADGEGEPD